VFMAMDGRIPEDVISQVREKTDIVQVIGQYVELKRAGANHKGLCPFHEEKTPSFNVNPARQFFHCFGCQESGDVFAFLMKIEGRQFAEVVEDLAAKAGVELRLIKNPVTARTAARRKSEHQAGVDLNDEVAKLYRDLLNQKEGQIARAYLEKRGIRQEVADSFLLGFAPSSGNAVVRLLEHKKIPMDFADRMGLVAKRKQGAGYHDRFWNRLIFPLVDVRGSVLGFGGRLLGEGDGPKYINTPDTPLYRKGTTLYGLHVAAPAIRRKDEALLVEGNFDVLQLHQWGFDHAVAPMGTAVTEQQVRLIKRFSKRVVALFDGDKAGRAAARRAVHTFVKEGLDAKIATLPEGEDPDSLLTSRGAESMAEVISGAIPALDYVLNELQAEMEDSIPGRAKLLEIMAPLVKVLESPVARELYADRLSLALAIDRGTVDRAIKGFRIAEKASNYKEKQKLSVLEQKKEVLPEELALLAILADHPHLFPRVEQAGVCNLLTNSELRATYQAAVEMQRSSGQVEVSKLLQLAPSNIRDAVADILLSGRFASDGDPTRALDDCVVALQRNELQRELREIQTNMADAKAKGDTDSMRALGLRLVDVERRIHETR
ncbi:MAG: DNA primase, partial [Pseudomonadota bacterium]